MPNCFMCDTDTALMTSFRCAHCGQTFCDSHAIRPGMALCSDYCERQLQSPGAKLRARIAAGGQVRPTTIAPGDAVTQELVFYLDALEALRRRIAEVCEPIMGEEDYWSIEAIAEECDKLKGKL